MNMPGFAAEAALYSARDRARVIRPLQCRNVGGQTYAGWYADSISRRDGAPGLVSPARPKCIPHKGPCNLPNSSCPTGFSRFVVLPTCADKEECCTPHTPPPGCVPRCGPCQKTCQVCSDPGCTQACTTVNQGCTFLA